MNDSEIFNRLKAAKSLGEMSPNVAIGREAATDILSSQEPSTNLHSGQIIVKEMFMHTTLKIYPNGSIYLEIKGRPKDIQYPHKAKAVKPIIDFKINRIKKELF